MSEHDPVNGAEILDPAHCWDLVRPADIARLAVAAAGEVDIFPVNIVVDDAITGPDGAPTLVFRSAEGTKLVELILAGRCAVEVDGVDASTNQAWSVVVKGHGELLDRQVDVDAARALPLRPWNAGPKERFVRIIAREISGRRFVIDRDAG